MASSPSAIRIASAHASRDGVGGEHLVAAERRRRPRRPRAPGTPRGDGAVQATTTSNSSARSASSIAVGSRSVPTTRIRRPSGWKSSKNTWAHESAPGGLWAPSTIDQRLVAEHLEAARHRDRGEPLLDDVRRQRRGEERLGGGQGDRGVVALVGAVQRHEHVGVDRRRRADVDEPPADGERVAGRLEVDAAQQPAGGRRLAEHGDEVRVDLADHRRRAGLDDPGLLPGDVGQRRAGELVVVHADVGDHGDLGVDDVGGVPAPEQADLDDGDVDGDVGEPAERRRRAGLEVARPDAGQPLEVGDGGDLLGELLVADRLRRCGPGAR